MFPTKGAFSQWTNRNFCSVVASIFLFLMTFLWSFQVKLTWLKFLGKFNDKFSIEQSISPFKRSYHQNLTFVSADCTVKWPSAPNPSVILAVGLLYCIIYALIFLERYSHRLCRKISASFFESQEDQRVQYLYKKLVRQYRKKEQQQP